MLGYFAYHAQSGRHNIHTKAEMNALSKQLKSDLIDIRKDRRILETKVSQLTNGSLEKDALDEAVRRNLGLIANDEIIILH